MEFVNTYQDTRRAAAYDELTFGGTYHLVFRDLPEILREHVTGRRAPTGVATVHAVDHRAVDAVAPEARFRHHRGGHLVGDDRHRP